MLSLALALGGACEVDPTGLTPTTRKKLDAGASISGSGGTVSSGSGGNSGLDGSVLDQASPGDDVEDPGGSGGSPDGSGGSGSGGSGGIGGSGGSGSGGSGGIGGSGGSGSGGTGGAKPDAGSVDVRPDVGHVDVRPDAGSGGTGGARPDAGSGGTGGVKPDAGSGGSGGSVCQCPPCQRCGTSGCEIDPLSRWEIVCNSTTVTFTTPGGGFWDKKDGNRDDVAPDPFCEFESIEGQVDTATAGVTDTVSDSYLPKWNAVVSPKGKTVRASDLMNARGTWLLWVGDDDGCTDRDGCSAQSICEVRPPMQSSWLKAGGTTIQSIGSCRSLSLKLVCKP